MRGYLPLDGHKPTIPQHSAGMRSDPPVSLPNPHLTMPAAIAAAVPEDDPLVVYLALRGFFVIP